jgi:hypothetical protein
MLAISRLNSLIDDVGSGELAAAIPTGNAVLTNLGEVLEGIGSGALAAAMSVMGTSLMSYIVALREDVNTLMRERGMAVNE